MRTYLYKLESPERNNGEDVDCYGLQLSGSGDCIAITAGNNDDTFETRLWDLNSKQLLRVFEGGSQAEFLLGDSLVGCSMDTIRVWNQTDGSLMGEYHLIPTADGIEFDWLSYKNMVFFTADYLHVHALDVRNGALRMNLMVHND